MIYLNIFSVILIYLVIIHCQAQGPPPAQSGDDDECWTINMASDLLVCDDDMSKAFMDTSKVDVVRYNETIAYMTGHMIFKQHFDDSFMIEIIIEKEENGHLMQVFSLEICNVCNEIKDPESMYHNYIQHFGFPDECPFEPGEYPIHNLMVDKDEMPCNKNNAGTYKATVTIKKAEDDSCKKAEFYACSTMKMIMEPCE